MTRLRGVEILFCTEQINKTRRCAIVASSSKTCEIVHMSATTTAIDPYVTTDMSPKFRVYHVPVRPLVFMVFNGGKWN